MPDSKPFLDPFCYNPAIVKARRSDPIFASEMVDLMVERFGIPADDAIQGVAEVFFMNPEKLRSFRAWLADEEPGDVEIRIPLNAGDLDTGGSSMDSPVAESDTDRTTRPITEFQQGHEGTA